MEITLDLVKEKIAASSYKFFDDDYWVQEVEASEDPFEDGQMVNVHSNDGGDGRGATKTVYIPKLDVYVTLEGWYSSYGGTEYNKIGFSKPYEYKETRYQIL